MSPKYERFAASQPDFIAASIGGSAFHPDRLNIDFIKDLADFFQELLAQKKTIFAVVGGGGKARSLEEDVKTLGVRRAKAVDQIGIAVTQVNALVLQKYLEARDIDFRCYSDGDLLKRGAGVIYVQGGSDPGHTTDFVTIQASHEAGQEVVLNISTEPGGINPRRGGEIIENELIEQMTWDEYFRIFPKEHKPGSHSPFDGPAALFAQKHKMTAILVGPDMNNLRKCLRGEEFRGTIVHP